MPPTIIHIVPVFDERNEPGWLTLTKRQNSLIAKQIFTISPDMRAWDASVKSWFVHHDRYDDMIDAIIMTKNGDVVFCDDCLHGSPCEAWADIQQQEYLIREPEEVEPPNRARKRYARVLMEWWEAKGLDGPEPPTRPRPAGNPWTQAQPPPWARRQPPGQNGRTTSAYVDQLFDDMFGDTTSFTQFMRGVRDVLNNRFRQPVSPPPIPQIKPTKMNAQEAAAVLGVGLPCSESQLKAAFKRAALKAHPDRGGSDEAMAKINVAMEVLGI